MARHPLLCLITWRRLPPQLTSFVKGVGEAAARGRNEPGTDSGRESSGAGQFRQDPASEHALIHPRRQVRGHDVLQAGVAPGPLAEFLPAPGRARHPEQPRQKVPAGSGHLRPEHLRHRMES